jgi:hypothetical protein
MTIDTPASGFLWLEKKPNWLERRYTLRRRDKILTFDSLGLLVYNEQEKPGDSSFQ